MKNKIDLNDLFKTADKLIVQAFVNQLNKPKLKKQKEYRVPLEFAQRWK